MKGYNLVMGMRHTAKGWELWVGRRREVYNDKCGYRYSKLTDNKNHVADVMG